MRNMVWLFVAVLFLSACQKDNNAPGTPGGAGTQAQGIAIDGSVPADQQGYIQKDMQTLASLPQLQGSSADAQLVSINSFDGATMTQYLHQRVKYIVGESYNFAKQASVIGDASGSPVIMNAMEMPQDILDSNSLITIMVNIGSSVYNVGKKYQTIYSLPVAGNNVTIDTNAVGIIQIGVGLFTEWLVKGTSADTLANTLIRLAVYIHEGTHSLGNGESATFKHTYCPSWHDFAGKIACDQYGNGPYAVEARFLKVLQTACTNCTSTELQTFKSFRADALNRVIPNSPIINDIRPERLVPG